MRVSSGHRVREQQALVVFRQGGETVVKGFENGKIFRREGQAERALQRAVDRLAAQGGGEVELMTTQKIPSEFDHALAAEEMLQL